MLNANRGIVFVMMAVLILSLLPMRNILIRHGPDNLVKAQTPGGEAAPVDPVSSNSNHTVNFQSEIPAIEFLEVSDSDRIWRDGDSLVWDGDGGWVEWKVSIPEDGEYRIGLVYDTVNEQNAAIVRGVQIDGAYPFPAAESLVLTRRYEHVSSDPSKRKRPPSREVPGWRLAWLADYSTETGPLRWQLSAGEHTIRLLGEEQPVRLQQIIISSFPETVSERDSGGPADEQAGEKAWIKLFEAEDIHAKSHPSIQLQSMQSAGMSPPADGRIRFNALGGEQFRQSGQWVEWTFDVPADGEYEIGFKYMQAYINNMNSFRLIEIDGATPYSGLKEVRFPYSTEWQGMTLAHSDGEPLRFQLKEGEHTLRMTVISAPIKPVYDGILENMDRLRELEYAIRKVTGNFDKLTANGNVDTSRDWDLPKYIPDFHERIDLIVSDLLELADLQNAVSTGGLSDPENALRSAARDLTEMRNNPANVPNELGRFAKIQQNLSTWLFRLLDQPLLLDYFWVAEPGARKPGTTPSFLDNVKHAALSFFRTFTIEDEFASDDSEAIDVWVNRGRDYVRLIQELAEETFTAETGIAVNVNIVPDPQMFILGNAAGIQPDVAMGIDQAMAMDFSMRGALTDLATFPDYEDTAEPFHPGALRVFHYRDGNYALPEIQDFQVLVYRTDILEGLNASPPDTWQDVYDLLPVLQQNGYDFFINPKDFMIFMFQNGAELYTDDGMRSFLDSEEAYIGFRQWTEMFTLYQLPREVPSFFNHFRKGDIPVGVTDFNTYLQIQFAAPELAGKWKIAPLPGVRQPDGSVARWAGGGMQAIAMFEQSDKKEQAWEFIKWWVSEETQSRFGQDIEALFGPEYRWNTANMDAFDRLPWPAEHLQTISEQRRWYKEAPQVPGGYFTARQLDFAWNKVVLQSGNIRQALETAVSDINREMTRKQVEFGLRDRTGTILEKLYIPPVTEPWNRGRE
ncbi:extracellular solute-binding protein [Paenibacillus senegalensis]|uniref:extracellular solute-binding protein n=1 Tax=Paenibacillus senegalensis TaxID=1465766 RepID=UPI00028979C3|nr:extracellular solute-binding protein [Paenibacillus senegalensis]